MNSNNCAQPQFYNQQVEVGQEIEARINQIGYVVNSAENNLLAEIFENDFDNLARVEEGNDDFDIVNFCFNDEDEVEKEELGKYLNNEVKMELDELDAEDIIKTIKIEEFFNEYNVEEKVAPLTINYAFVQYNQQPAVPQQSNVLSDLMLQSGITNLDDGIESCYGSPNYSVYSPASSSSGYESSPSQYGQVYTQSSQSQSNLLENRGRGRPSNNWLDQNYIDELIKSANGDPNKLKQIRNNIASGKYRLKKKIKKTMSSSVCDELLQLQNENKKLRRIEHHNAVWIEQIKTIIARRTNMPL